MGIVQAKCTEFIGDWRYPHPVNTEIDHRKGPTFDPMLGFPNGRKQRGILRFLFRTQSFRTWVCISPMQRPILPI